MMRPPARSRPQAQQHSRRPRHVGEPRFFDRHPTTGVSRRLGNATLSPRAEQQATAPHTGNECATRRLIVAPPTGEYRRQIARRAVGSAKPPTCIWVRGYVPKNAEKQKAELTSRSIADHPGSGGPRWQRPTIHCDEHNGGQQETPREWPSAGAALRQDRLEIQPGSTARLSQTGVQCIECSRARSRPPRLPSETAPQ